MKLRIQDNALRLRLKRPEVDALVERGEVRSAITFGPGSLPRLEYALFADPEVEELRVGYDGHRIHVTMPARWAADWRSSDRVGFESSLELGGHERLHVLIEKDFRCIENEIEEEGSYPNPASHAC